MKNFVQPGKTITITAAAVLASGVGVKIGDLVGVTLSSAAIGEEVAVALEGVFELPKATGAVSQGVILYWDDAAKNVTTTVGSNKVIGYAFAAQLSGDATVLVSLDR